MYRICTEDVNRETIHAILDAHVPGYAVMPGIGSWKGQREKSLTIDLIDTPLRTAREIAEAIKTANNQEAVLLLDIPVVAEFI